jgi:hypothetical protein
MQARRLFRAISLACRFRSVKKWAQPITIDALGHLTPGFHHQRSTSSIIPINDKRANQSLPSSFDRPHKLQVLMFQFPSWKLKVGRAGFGFAKTLRCPSRQKKSTLKWGRSEAVFIRNGQHWKFCTAPRFLRAVRPLFIYQKSFSKSKGRQVLRGPPAYLVQDSQHSLGLDWEEPTV